MLARLRPEAPFSLDDRRAQAVLICAGLLCLLAYGVTILLPHSDGHLIGSDGRSYFATLRSLVFDQDFDFTNEYAWVGYEPKPLTATGLPENPFAIGVPILWLPFFLLGHALSVVLSGLGLDVATNGLGLIYEAAVCLATVVYGSVAFLLIYRVTRRLFDPVSACIACLVMWGGTAAIHYMVAEPFMSHGVTLFTTSLFLVLWYPLPAERSRWSWLAVGSAVGLMALVRWQDGLIALLPAAELVYRVGRRQLAARTALANGASAALVALIVMTPQFIMWQTVYGTPLTIPQGSSFFNWLDPKPWQTLFSMRHGLITWHPVLLFSLLGLAPLWRRDRGLTLAILALFVLQLYLNSAVAVWWAHDAFGGRRFTSLIPLLVIPLAAFLYANRRRPALHRAMLVLFGLLIIWNALGMVQFTLLFVSRSEALTVKEMTVDRFLLPLQLLSRVIN